MRGHFKDMLNLCLLRKNEETLKSEAEINAYEYKLSEDNPELFSYVFDKLTTDVINIKTLVKILISITLRFSRSAYESEFHFCADDLKELHSITQLDFVLSADPRDLSVIDCNYTVFQQIRQKYINQSIYKSLLRVSNYCKIINMESEGGGRSGSFIFVTTDQKFVLKSITKQEYLVLSKKLLQSYSKRILECEESRLVRIFGVFHLKYFGQFVMIMENVVYKKEESFVFDLKGSRVGRHIKDISDPLNPPLGVVLKDINFEEFGLRVSLYKESKENLIKNLIEDFKLLKEVNIMDYSILLALRRGSKYFEDTRFTFLELNGYLASIGIIDFLQEYDMSKIGEAKVKGLFHSNDFISSVDPESYFLRISDYLDRILL